MRSRRAIFVFVAVVMAVALVGVARVRIIRSAQADVLTAIDQQIELFEARSTTVAGAEQAIRDNASMQQSLNSKKLALSALGTAGALAAAAVAAAACAAVAWSVGSARSVVAMGLWVWFVNGAAVGAIAQYGTSTLVRFAQFPSFVAPRVPTVGFASYLVVGLASTFFWQSLLPAAAAGYLGLKARTWWLSVSEIAQGFESQPLADRGVNLVSTSKSRTCQCGAVNLLDRTSCYACGSSLLVAGE